MEAGRPVDRPNTPSAMRWEDWVVYGRSRSSSAAHSWTRSPESTRPGPTLGVLELGIFVLMAASLLTLEQNVVGENTGVAELFLYAGATAVLMGLVLLMPPYRPGNWLSGRGSGS